MRPGLRYTLAGGTVLLSALCGWYFWYAPSRMVTRVTVYPATQQVGLRTAAAPPVCWLPAALRQRAFFQRAGLVSPVDSRERLVPLTDVYRLQGSAVGSEMAQWARLAKDGTPTPPAVAARLAKHSAVAKADQQDTLMLRVGDARLAFQLSGAPHRDTLLAAAPKRGVRRMGHLLLRSPTDWASAPGYLPSTPEQTAKAERDTRGLDTEPWFLDRAQFDELFPLDASRYKRT